MRVIDPGHQYWLRELDLGSMPQLQTLTFVKREGPGYPGNVGHHKGTTMQEVLRVLIDRIKYVDNQIHDQRNIQVLYNLRSAIYELEMRAAKRHGRSLSGFNLTEIENVPVCEKCGHIGCEGDCHKE